MAARLPNGERAVVDIRKLTQYCLNPNHPRGRHKARMFASALGVTLQDAHTLRDLLMRAASDIDADALPPTPWSNHWRLDVEVAGQMGSVVIRTLWIIRAGEDFPRLVTCWVL